MRLAFSIFAFLKPEILLLDEVFSVGDIAFQNKCINRIKLLIQNGVSVIIVTHSMIDIQKISSKVLILKNGEINDIGTTSEMINTYLKDSFLKDKDGNATMSTYKKFKSNEASNHIISLIDVAVRAKNKKINEPIIRTDDIIIEVQYSQNIKEQTQFMLKINSISGDVILMDSYAIRENYVPQKSNVGLYKMEILISKELFNSGIFFISLVLANKDSSHQNKGLEVRNILAFEVHLTEWEKKMTWTNEIDSIFRPTLKWQTIKTNDL